MHTDSPAIPLPAGPRPQQLTLDQLASHGWSQQNQFLPAELTLALAAECRALAAAGVLDFAAVGRGAGQALRPEIRGDQTLWLEAAARGAAGDPRAPVAGRLVPPPRAVAAAQPGPGSGGRHAAPSTPCALLKPCLAQIKRAPDFTQPDGCTCARRGLC